MTNYSIPEEVRCKVCDGEGKVFPSCESCEGRGWVDDPEDGGTMECPVCKNEECEECNGTGEIQVPA